MYRPLLSTLCFALLSTIVACDGRFPSEGEGEGEGEGEVLPPGESARSLQAFNTSPSVEEVDLVTAGDNALLVGLELLAATPTTTASPNTVLSPVSVLEAFGMLSAGANGETLTELEAVLRFTDQATQHAIMNAWNVGFASRNLPARLEDLDNGIGAADAVTLHLVNQLFAEQTFNIEPAFLDTTSSRYDAGVQRVDFKTDAENIRQDINAWVLDQTRDRIKDLLPADSLSTDTRLVLVNALYLKAPWQTPFNEGTTDAIFHAASGDVTVPYLTGEQAGGFVTVGDIDVVDIPLRGDALTLTLFIDRGADAADDSELLAAWQALPSIEAATLELTMPAFTIDSTTPLKKALQDLGVTALFDAETCDLDGLSSEDPDLYVSGAFHKAFVAVDESGVEAAAATAIVVDTETSLPQGIEVLVDEPFTFVIRDRALNAPLFVGRVEQP